MNNWRAQLRDGTKTAAEVGETLAAREAELDARDAALRGQLHDLARFQEQLLSREREIAGRVADVQAEADLLLAGTNEAAEREADFARREQELQRRENAIAQRWSRLAATTCPHCGMPINAAPSDAA